jgi:hypothetical protein
MRLASVSGPRDWGWKSVGVVMGCGVVIVEGALRRGGSPLRGRGGAMMMTVILDVNGLMMHVI